MSTMLSELRRELRSAADPEKAPVLRRFFKTGKGEYADGDRFIGVMVPDSRRLAARYADLPFAETKCLLASPIHEERFTALAILVGRFERGDEKDRRAIYELYVRSARFINNWDLVDVSAKQIIGAYLFTRSTAPLFRLARSKNIWQRRMAVLATFYFIGRGRLGESLRLAKMLLGDDHDLMHKAVGWMLREVGKKSRPELEKFLDEHAARMQRTMLRYAIEKFPEPERKKYLRKPARPR